VPVRRAMLPVTRCYLCRRGDAIVRSCYSSRRAKPRPTMPRYGLSAQRESSTRVQYRHLIVTYAGRRAAMLAMAAISGYRSNRREVRCRRAASAGSNYRGNIAGRVGTVGIACRTATGRRDACGDDSNGVRVSRERGREA